MQSANFTVCYNPWKSRLNCLQNQLSAVFAQRKEGAVFEKGFSLLATAACVRHWPEREILIPCFSKRNGGEHRRQKIDVKAGQCGWQRRAIEWQSLEEEGWLAGDLGLFSSSFGFFSPAG